MDTGAFSILATCFPFRALFPRLFANEREEVTILKNLTRCCSFVYREFHRNGERNSWNNVSIASYREIRRMCPTVDDPISLAFSRNECAILFGAYVLKGSRSNVYYLAEQFSRMVRTYWISESVWLHTCLIMDDTISFVSWHTRTNVFETKVFKVSIKLKKFFKIIQI